MREILFRGKLRGSDKWAESVCPIGVLYAGHLCSSFIPDTVGQHTGLPDKNGKRVFEGDIVASTSERRLSNKACVVKFHPLSGYWMLDPKREPVVIGNVHDNPELLQGTDNG